MTSMRAKIRPALERCIVRLRERRYPVDVGVLRVLRDFGLECVQIMHASSTVPAPPLPTDSETTGRYSVQHPLRAADEEKGT